MRQFQRLALSHPPPPFPLCCLVMLLISRKEEQLPPSIACRLWPLRSMTWEQHSPFYQVFIPPPLFFCSREDFSSPRLPVDEVATGRINKCFDMLKKGPMSKTSDGSQAKIVGKKIPLFILAFPLNKFFILEAGTYFICHVFFQWEERSKSTATIFRVPNLLPSPLRLAVCLLGFGVLLLSQYLSALSILSSPYFPPTLLLPYYCTVYIYIYPQRRPSMDCFHFFFFLFQPSSNLYKKKSAEPTRWEEPKEERSFSLMCFSNRK